MISNYRINSDLFAHTSASMGNGVQAKAATLWPKAQQVAPMNRKRTNVLMLGIFSALSLSIAQDARAFSGENFLPQARLSLKQARKIAAKAYPGTLVSEELERESGGSGLRYSFVIQHNGVKHEVGVDAKTGTVLENSIEGENPD